jgi:hypothetical protein
VARPSKLTGVLIENFCSVLRTTGSIETAIKHTGISRASYFGWKRAVRQGGGTKLQAKLFAAVDRVEGERKSLVEWMLFKQMEKHWRPCAWWLERKYPNEYGRRRPQPLSNPNDLDADPTPRHITWREYPPLPADRVEPAPAECKPTESTQAEDDPRTAESISVAWVPGNYYETLGLKPVAGRLLRSDDDSPDAQPVAVITDDFWALRFGHDLTVLGQSIRIAGVAITIVGVCPEFTDFPDGNMVDMVMADGMKAPILAGFGLRMNSNTHWILGTPFPGDLYSPRRS